MSDIEEQEIQKDEDFTLSDDVEANLIKREKEEIEEMEEKIISQDKPAKKTTKKPKTKEEKANEDPNNLEGLDGIGDTTIEKLKSVSVLTISDLAVYNASDLYTTLSRDGSVKNITLDSCMKLVVLANLHMQKYKMLDKPLLSSTVLLKKSTGRKRFSVGDDAYDAFLGGGFESGAVTELYGKFGTGKTQSCYCASVLAANDGKRVLYVDTEDTYQPERIDEIAREKGLDPQKIHENIMVLRPPSVSMFIQYMRNLSQYITEEKIELIIVDSIIALHKAEYFGRGLLAPRQQSLTGIMSRLKQASEYYNCGVIITNHIIANPDPYTSGGSEIPAGGNSIAHYSTHRIYLQTKPLPHSQKYSVVTMDDSPRYPRSQIAILLNKQGVTEYRVKLKT